MGWHDSKEDDLSSVKEGVEGRFKGSFFSRHKKKFATAAIAATMWSGLAGTGIKQASNFVDNDTGTHMSQSVPDLGIKSAYAESIIDVYKSLPGAVNADPDGSVIDAWALFHKLNKKALAENIIFGVHDRTQLGGYMPMRESSNYSSHIDWLLTVQMGIMGNVNANSSFDNNRGLKWYVDGVQRLYTHDNFNARQSFANGMFVSAQLGPNDYQRMHNAGVDVDWQPSLDVNGNALNLAKKFVGMDIRNKNLVLNVGIGDKFKNVSGKTDKPFDTTTPEYALKNVYFNLGFYILADYNYGNKNESIELRNNHNNFYYNCFKKFKFNTASNGLI